MPAAAKRRSRTGRFAIAAARACAMMLLVTDDPYAVAAASAARLTALTGRPDVAVVLGSGWAPAADAIGPRF